MAAAAKGGIDVGAILRGLRCSGRFLRVEECVDGFVQQDGGVCP